MNVKGVQVGVCVMGLVWTASGALAATPEARAVLAEERLVGTENQSRPRGARRTSFTTTPRPS